MSKKNKKSLRYLKHFSMVFFMVLVTTVLLFKADIRYEIDGYLTGDTDNTAVQGTEQIIIPEEEIPETIEDETLELIEDEEVDEVPHEKLHVEEIKKIEDIYVKSALLIGDSMMQGGIGYSLESYLKNSGAQPVSRVAIQSTGLLHPERLDWYAKIDELMGPQQYDLVLIMWGLNDTDHFKDETGVLKRFNTPEWEEAYALRIDRMIEKIIDENQGKVLVWIGLPIVKDEEWDWKVRLFNKLYEQEANKYHDVIYIDTYKLFSKDGAYTATLTNKAGETKVARHTDHLHLNSFGGAILSEYIIDELINTQVKFGDPPAE